MDARLVGPKDMSVRSERLKALKICVGLSLPYVSNFRATISWRGPSLRSNSGDERGVSCLKPSEDDVGERDGDEEQ
jgi:hypothetical protein